MSELVRLFLDGDDGLQGTVLEILTILADPDNMDQETEKNTYLEMFYDHFVDKLTERISFGSVNEEECKKKTSKNEMDEEEIITLEEEIAKECEEANRVKIMENFNDIDGMSSFVHPSEGGLKYYSYIT